MTLCIDNGQQAHRAAHANQYPAVFANRIGIFKGESLWIVEYGTRLIEGYTVLSQIARSLGWIKFNLHNAEL